MGKGRSNANAATSTILKILVIKALPSIARSVPSSASSFPRFNLEPLFSKVIMFVSPTMFDATVVSFRLDVTVAGAAEAAVAELAEAAAFAPPAFLFFPWVVLTLAFGLAENVKVPGIEGSLLAAAEVVVPFVVAADFLAFGAGDWPASVPPAGLRVVRSEEVPLLPLAAGISKSISMSSA